MNQSLFEFMPSKALIGLVSANNIKEKSFSNPEWYEAYQEFVEATGFKDMDADKFNTYVKFYAKIGSLTTDRQEVMKDGAVRTMVTRQISSDFTKKNIGDYREQMMGSYYGNR